MERTNKNTKILVTGAAGFLGRHLVEKLTDAGYQVRALVRKTADHGHLQNAGVELCFGDLSDPASFSQAVSGMDAVIHAAAAMSGAWEDYLNVNAKSTEYLLDEFHKAGGKKFIYISTILVHDTNKSGPITEDTPIVQEKDADYYTRSKIIAEDIIAKFHNHTKFSTVIIRPGLIYGEYGKLYIPRMGYALGFNRFMVVGNGNNRLPAVYVKNLAEAIVLAVEKDEANGHVFNVVDNPEFTQKDYLERVKSMVLPRLAIYYVPYFVMLAFSEMLGILFKLLKKNNPFARKFMFLCSHEFIYLNDKLKDKLGWLPEVKWSEALKRTMQWHNNNLMPKRKIGPRVRDRQFRISKPEKAAIVGCGQIALTHIPILKRIEGVEIVGVCDPDAKNAAFIADKFNIKNVHSTIEELITSERPNVVHILTPPHLHKAHTLYALKNRCHVYVEKPMAVNAQDAEEMVQAAEEQKIKLCVGHNHLYDPVMIEARDLIAKHLVGNIVYVESWYGFNLGENPNSRYMRPGAKDHWTFKMPGGLYQNLAPHALCVLTDIIGYPEKIYATGRHSGVVKAMDSDELRVFVETKKSMGMVSLSLAVNPRYQTLNIYGTKMTLFLDFLNKTVIKQGAVKGIPKAISRTLMNFSQAKTIVSSTFKNTFQALRKTFTYYEGTEILIREFYQSIVKDKEAPVSGEEGLQNMQLMDRIWRQLSKD
ncbi:MAG: NAD-dependent epimerase/dehydratase family protein [Candidatus Omnitrophota bacterium]